jgi:hypothetical protein
MWALLFETYEIYSKIFAAGGDLKFVPILQRVL